MAFLGVVSVSLLDDVNTRMSIENTKSTLSFPIPSKLHQYQLVWRPDFSGKYNFVYSISTRQRQISGFYSRISPTIHNKQLKLPDIAR